MSLEVCKTRVLFPAVEDNYKYTIHEPTLGGLELICHGKQKDLLLPSK